MDQISGLKGRTGAVSARTTVSEYLEQWRTASLKSSVSGATFDGYSRNIRKHIAPNIGGVRLNKLEAHHVEAMLATIGHLNGRMRRYVLTILSRALDKAVARGLIQRNPCDTVERPRVEPFEIQPLTGAQCNLLTAASKPERLHALFVLAVDTGCRQGELLALSWPDIDFENAAISIRRTTTEAGGKTLLKEPKTKAGRRRIPLPMRSLAALGAHRKRMLAEGNARSQFVFCNESGGLLSRFHVKRVFKRLLKQAGLPDVRFHDLRHSHATLLLALNENPKLVSERLGHTKISVTMDTYSHVVPTMQGGITDKLNKHLG